MSADRVNSDPRSPHVPQCSFAPETEPEGHKGCLRYSSELHLACRDFPRMAVRVKEGDARVMVILRKELLLKFIPKREKHEFQGSHRLATTRGLKTRWLNIITTIIYAIIFCFASKIHPSWWGPSRITASNKNPPFSVLPPPEFTTSWRHRPFQG